MCHSDRAFSWSQYEHPYIFIYVANLWTPAFAENKGVDVELVAASQAVENLITEYGKLVFHLIYSLTGEWETSEDLTQDTFLYALRAIDAARLARGEDFHAKAWLLRIAVNTARMHLRRRRLIRFHSLSALSRGEATDLNGLQTASSPVQPAGCTAQETEDPAERVSERDAVSRVLARLPEGLRLPLLLSTVAGFSISEIAAMLTMNEVAVRKRLSRARRAFQQIYTAQSRDEQGPHSWRPRLESSASSPPMQRVLKQSLVLPGNRYMAAPA